MQGCHGPPVPEDVVSAQQDKSAPGDGNRASIVKRYDVPVVEP